MRQERHGIFEGHEIWGKQYESDDGVFSWLIGAWPTDEGPGEVCWVSGGNILGFESTSFDGKKLVQALGPISEMSAEMKGAIVKAIGEWEAKAKGEA